MRGAAGCAQRVYQCAIIIRPFHCVQLALLIRTVTQIHRCPIRRSGLDDTTLASIHRAPTPSARPASVHPSPLTGPVTGSFAHLSSLAARGGGEAAVRENTMRAWRLPACQPLEAKTNVLRFTQPRGQARACTARHCKAQPRNNSRHFWPSTPYHPGGYTSASAPASAGHCRPHCSAAECAAALVTKSRNALRIMDESLSESSPALRGRR